MRRLRGWLARPFWLMAIPFVWIAELIAGDAWCFVALMLLAFAGCAPHRVVAVPTPAGNTLTLRASPPLCFPGAPVLLIAEVSGEPSEKFYCPLVRWVFPTDPQTKAEAESDCPPFEQRDYFERRWTYGIRIGRPGEFVFAVELVHASRVEARATATVRVVGDVGGMIAGADPFQAAAE